MPNTSTHRIGPRAGEPVYIKVRRTSSSQKSVLIPVGLVAVDDERRTLVLR